MSFHRLEQTVKKLIKLRSGCSDCACHHLRGGKADSLVAVEGIGNTHDEVMILPLLRCIVVQILKKNCETLMSVEELFYSAQESEVG
jgi:hypothetical protein